MLRLILQTWNEHYPGVTGYTPYEKQKSEVVSSDKSIHVFNSDFQELNSVNQGGAVDIYASSDDIRVLIEECTFNACSAESGGAVYYGQKGHCVFSKVCGHKCSCTGWGEFSYVITSSTSTTKNELHLCSVCYSNGTGPSTLSIKSGVVVMNNDNISNNKCDNDPAFFISECKLGEDGFSIKMKHCSIANNEATSMRVLYFTQDSNGIVSQCNFLYNKQTYETYGLIAVKKILLITESCILKNTAKYFVEGPGPTIAATYVTIDKCSIDFSQANTKGNVVIEEKIEESFINRIIGYKRGVCVANYDAVDNLPPLEYFKDDQYGCTAYCRPMRNNIIGQSEYNVFLYE